MASTGGSVARASSAILITGSRDGVRGKVQNSSVVTSRSSPADLLYMRVAICTRAEARSPRPEVRGPLPEPQGANFAHVIGRHHGASTGDELLRRAWLRRNTLGVSRRLLAAQPVAFRLAAEGPVCVRGTVSPLEGDRGERCLIAPLSGQPCLAYELSIAFFRERTHPEAWLRHARGSAFRLDDGVDWALIDPGEPPAGPVVVRDPRHASPGLSVRVRPRMEGLLHPDRDRAPHLEAILEQLVSAAPRRCKLMELNEARIVPGDRIKVLGFGAREAHPDGVRAGPRDPPLRYVVAAADGQLILGDP